MSKKNSSIVHIGERSFWSGKVRTECGLTLATGSSAKKKGSNR